MRTLKITAPMLRAMKQRGERIPSLTAYDYPSARILDEAGIPFILVGDSLGMVVLGYPDTTLVTMEEMEHQAEEMLRSRQLLDEAIEEDGEIERIIRDEPHARRRIDPSSVAPLQPRVASPSSPRRARPNGK